MEPLEGLYRAVDVLIAKVSGVRPEQLHDPTPCEEFDVEALLNHILIVLRMLATGAETGVADELEFVVDGQTRRFEGRDVAWLVESDPVAQCVEMAKRITKVWAEPGVSEKQIRWGPWGTVSGRAAAAIGIRELVIHAWDVAKATGQDTTLPDDLTEALLAWMTRHDAAMRAPMGFHAKVELPTDASPTDRLAAFAGRTP